MADHSIIGFRDGPHIKRVEAPDNACMLHVYTSQYVPPAISDPAPRGFWATLRWVLGL